MAANFVNNLYPPIIDTYMPAFVYEDRGVSAPICRVYFSLSAYNSPAEIDHVQMTIVNQNTNMSVIDTLHPTGIKLARLKEDTTLTSDDRYYINIWSDDITDFDINQFYKIQLRFSDIGPEDSSDDNMMPASGKWLLENTAHFSEWSTVCLIKGIKQPILALRGFSEQQDNQETVFTNNSISFVGKLDTQSDKELLKQYKIDLYENGSNELLQSSGIIFTNSANPNELNYTFKYSFENEKSYIALVTYTTNNLYSQTLQYKFRIVLTQLNKLNADIFAYIDNDEGRIKVDIKSRNNDPFIGNIVIRRTSSDSNFTIWEDMKIVAYSSGGALAYTWYDTTVQSGVWYKYDAHRIDSNGNRGLSIITNDPVMIILDDIFLTTLDKQLKVKYDPQVSSFKHTLLETKTDTLGSQFPFIRRNGNLNYRQFSISGLISHLMDENELFITRKDLYGESKPLFDKYNYNNRITQYKDYTQEKLFREKVTEFLYDGKVKLFRSPTEGNILVRLMDISLTPNQQLGRLVYSFSATAYEIDTISYENYEKYNICYKGNYEVVESAVQLVLGQINATFDGKTTLKEVLETKYKTYANQGYEITVKDVIPWVKITFNSDPYLISEEATLVPYSGTGTADYYGYIVTVDDNQFLIQSDSVEFENIHNISFYPPVDSKVDVQIDYTCQIVERESVEEMPYILYYKPKVGQLWGTFQPNEYLYSQIYNKYFEKYETTYQYITKIKEIEIEAQQNGTVVYIKEREDSDYNRHIVGDTQTLRIEGDIENFYFSGIHFNATDSPDRDLLRADEFISTGEIYDSVDEISQPKRNHVYYITGTGDMIYYENAWYSFTPEGDILVPVDAIVNYYCDALKGETL